jgi:hypothetical protein
MPILDSDIKLLKSAVMADTADGGGAMTGAPIVDGQSNNLFPDTSAGGRAIGRFQARKVFGVAHTTDTDTLMGAHAMVSDAPDDPLVHCALMRTTGWADRRSVAQDSIERYLVKGSRLGARLMEMHYAGSMQMRLVSFTGAAFPAGGDAVALHNPDGAEQYLRILKVSIADELIALTEGGQVLTLPAKVATCQLGQPLAMDCPGPPAVRVLSSETAYTQIFRTVESAGARFYGIKRLAEAGEPGDYGVTADGGIYTPLVPAATVESPIVDQYPLTLRQPLSRTAASTVALPAVTLTLGPNVTLTLPTLAEPGSVAMVHGAVAFTDDGAGALKQGATIVGAIDYRGRTVTMAAGAPSYGNQSNTITYKPATPSGAATHSDALTITLANQGLSFVHAFEPVPAPGTLSLAYMSQGRWYDLADAGNGKLAGSDPSHGVGTINYTTGSMAVTLGAIPDIDSALIEQWGDAASGKPITTGLPARLSALLPIDVRAKRESVTLAWSRGAANYTATVNAAGVLSGHATGTMTPGSIEFAPAVLPDGDVTLAYDMRTASQVAANNGGGSYTLSLVPVTPGSVSFQVATVAQAGYQIPAAITAITDNGAGQLYSIVAGAPVWLGTVDYVTGAVQIYGSVAVNVLRELAKEAPILNGGTRYYTAWEWVTGLSVQLQHAAVVAITHAGGATEVSTASVAPAFGLRLPLATGLKLATSALMFRVGSTLYHSLDGVLSQGWSVATAAPTVASAGSVADSGSVTVASAALPADGANSVTWINAAQNASGVTVGQGVFRTASAPLKVGVLQLQAGANIGTVNNSGVISGGGFSGTVDFQRGIVRWSRTAGQTGPITWGQWQGMNPVAADALSYNAVFLQYLPLSAALLGLETARLPLDGKVPIYRAGELAVVHNTQPTVLPNPLTRDVAHSLGRERIAAVKVVDALGALVPSTLYTAALDAGTLTVPATSNLTAYTLPFTAHHRIEDMLLVSEADISWRLKFTRSLTHDFPAETSYVSSALVFGDLFARVHSLFEQATWSATWKDTRSGDAILAAYDDVNHPLIVTNEGAITERFALIFSNTTTFSIVGENVGVIGTGSINETAAPINPATGVPYFSIAATGWGSGWAAGQVLRFNTEACGAPFWVVRTVLQGPATLASDKFELAFRGDVNA